MKTKNKYSPKVRERAVRMVFEHEDEYSSQWTVIQSIAQKIGCSPETLRQWIRQAERNEGLRQGGADRTPEVMVSFIDDLQEPKTPCHGCRTQINEPPENRGGSWLTFDEQVTQFYMDNMDIRMDDFVSE